VEIEASCEELGLSLTKEKEKITIKNHGIRTYAGTPVTIIKQKDGTYILQGDCSKSEIDKLSQKILNTYQLRIIIKEAQKNGFTLVNKTKEKGKIKLKLRNFS